MRSKSVINEAREIQLCVELINLGARLQLLQEETSLSRERLLRLYKEVKGESPSKGMLPYSTDWFMSWLPNIHSSVFMDIYHFVIKHSSVSGVEALIKSYCLYKEQMDIAADEEPVLSITRAWFMLRFFDAKLLQLTGCKECGGHFVVHADELCNHYSCGICRPPSRAGKTKKAAQAELNAMA
jgi:flagellar transcriptional activator FlhC